VLVILSVALKRWLRIWGRGVEEKTARLVTRWGEGWVAFWGDVELTRIRPAQVEDLYLHRNDGERSASALNTEKEYLGAFMLWCARHEYRNGDPTDVWPSLRVVVKKQYVFLTREEEDALHRGAVECWLKDYITVGICTGLRQGAIRLLERDWIQDGWLIVPAEVIKQREPYRLLLAPRALEVLARAGSSSPCHAIPEGSGMAGPLRLLYLPRAEYVWKRFKIAVKRAGINPATSPHDLRRTFCYRLGLAGVSPERIRTLGGWRSRGVFLDHYFWPMDQVEARRIVEAL
jgi:integrase